MSDVARQENRTEDPASGELADRDDLAAAMSAFYEQVDAAIGSHNPTCQNRGACCKFGSFGHRLYVTDLELAYFVRGRGTDWRHPTDDDACPYQIDGMCTAREHRPLGCRIFFCDANAQGWQGPEYERFQERLKQLGEQHGVPYRYREWLSALRDQDVPERAHRQSYNGSSEGETGGAGTAATGKVDAYRLPVIQ